MSDILAGTPRFLRLLAVGFTLGSVLLTYFGIARGEWWVIYIGGFSLGAAFDVVCILIYQYYVSRRYDRMWSKYNKPVDKNKQNK